MTGTGIIDNFLATYTAYIDSGFGLVQGDVNWLAGTLIAIDITLAGLFWALAPQEDVIARLIRKTLYIGLFAFILGNFNTLAQVIFNSFAGLGLEAGGGTLTQAQLLEPGYYAQIGINAGQPLITAINGMMGFTSFFANFVQIATLFIAWLILVLSFFIIAIQLFVILLEFKLTTLAGFILVPFALFGRTAFLCEKVLGNVVSSGIKILLLAVIVGIGGGIFSQFAAGMENPPTINDALTYILASLAMLCLSIYGPSIANGLIAGGPQLGAGAAATTAMAVPGMAFAGLAAGTGAARTLGNIGSGIAHAGAAAAGGATAAFKTGGLAGVAKAGMSAAASPLRKAAAGFAQSYAAGAQAATQRPAPGAGPAPGSGAAASGAAKPPAWAQRMQRRQAITQGVATAAQTLRSGDQGGAGHSPDLSEGDE